MSSVWPNYWLGQGLGHSVPSSRPPPPNADCCGCSCEAAVLSVCVKVLLLPLLLPCRVDSLEALKAKLPQLRASFTVSEDAFKCA